MAQHVHIMGMPRTMRPLINPLPSRFSGTTDSLQSAASSAEVARLFNFTATGTSPAWPAGGGAICPCSSLDSLCTFATYSAGSGLHVPTSPSVGGELRVAIAFELMLGPGTTTC